MIFYSPNFKKLSAEKRNKIMNNYRLVTNAFDKKLKRSTGHITLKQQTNRKEKK